MTSLFYFVGDNKISELHRSGSLAFLPERRLNDPMASFGCRLTGTIFACPFVAGYDMIPQAVQILVSDPESNLTEKEIATLFTVQKVIYGLVSSSLCML